MALPFPFCHFPPALIPIATPHSGSRALSDETKSIYLDGQNQTYRCTELQNEHWNLSLESFRFNIQQKLYPTDFYPVISKGILCIGLEMK